MNQRKWVIAFLALLALAAAFVLGTSTALPPVVASHFSGSGMADDFSPRSAYLLVWLLLQLGVPLLVAFLPFAVIRWSGDQLSIPNSQYWLAPERRDETFTFLRLWGLSLASAIVVFLAYAHWLLVQANQHQPPVLSTSAIINGLEVFFAALAIWLVAPYVRFRERA